MIEIKTLARLLNFNIEVIYQHDAKEKHKWSADIPNFEIDDGCLLSTNYCFGETPTEALQKLAMNIAGKKIVRNPASKEKKFEYNVPNDLCYIEDEK